MRRTTTLVAVASLALGSLTAACGSSSGTAETDQEAPRAPGDSVPDSGPSGATPGGTGSADVGNGTNDEP